MLSDYDEQKSDNQSWADGYKSFSEGEDARNSSTLYESRNPTSPSIPVTNQCNPYQELNNDLWNDIFPLDKNPATSNVQRLNSDIRMKIFPSYNQNLLDNYPSVSDYRNNNSTMQSIGRSACSAITDEINQILPAQKISGSSLHIACTKSDGTVKSPDYLVHQDVHEGTEPFEPKLINSQLVQGSRRTFSENIYQGVDGEEDIFYTPESMKQEQTSVASLEEVYDSIVETDNTINVDEVPLINTSNITRRPLPCIPITRHENLNINSRKMVPRKICILIALIILFVLVVVGVITVVVIFTGAGANNTDYKVTTQTDIKTTTVSGNMDTPSLLSFLHNPRLLAVIPGDIYKWGVTVLDDQLYVVPAMSSHVTIYNTTNFTVTGNQTIEGASNLVAIITSPRFNCLYVSDVTLSVVHRYNIYNNVITQWPVGGSSYGLSLTSTGNVLVTLAFTKRIEEYTPDGTLIRVISLDRSIIDPQHSIQVANDQFLVSHGYSEQLHRVCLVNATGHVLRSYGGILGSGVGQLYGPRQLVLDGANNVLVSDHSNNRLVLLSPSLDLLGYILILGYHLDGPWGLHYDQLNHRLYVAEESSSGRVFVLTV